MRLPPEVRSGAEQRDPRPGSGPAALPRCARSGPCLPRPALDAHARLPQGPGTAPQPPRLRSGCKLLQKLKPRQEPVSRPGQRSCPDPWRPGRPGSRRAFWPICHTLPPEPPGPSAAPSMAQKPKVEPHVGRLGYLQALVTEFQETESQGEGDTQSGGEGTGQGSGRDRRPGPGSSAAFLPQTPRSKCWPTSPTSPTTPATTRICDSCRSSIYSSIRCRRRMRPWWSLLSVRMGPASQMPDGLW